MHSFARCLVPLLLVKLIITACQVMGGLGEGGGVGGETFIILQIITVEVLMSLYFLMQSQTPRDETREEVHKETSDDLDQVPKKRQVHLQAICSPIFFLVFLTFIECIASFNFADHPENQKKVAHL